MPARSPSSGARRSRCCTPRRRAAGSSRGTRGNGRKGRLLRAARGREPRRCGRPSPRRPSSRPERFESASHVLAPRGDRGGRPVRQPRVARVQALVARRDRVLLVPPAVVVRGDLSQRFGRGRRGFRSEGGGHERETQGGEGTGASGHRGIGQFFWCCFIISSSCLRCSGVMFSIAFLICSCCSGDAMTPAAPSIPSCFV